MKRCNGIIFLFFLSATIITFSSAYAQERGSLSISEREIIERLVRLEEGQKNLQTQINGLQDQMKGFQNQISGLQDQMKGFQNQIIGFQNHINGLQNHINGLQSQINGLRNLILGGFAVVFAGIFSLIGFVLWDRRSAISPVITKTREMEERELLILRAMKEYALKEPRMSEVLKSLGLL